MVCAGTSLDEIMKTQKRGLKCLQLRNLLTAYVYAGGNLVPGAGDAA